MENLVAHCHVRELHARRKQRLALRPGVSLLAVHSALSVGLERAKMIGRSFSLLMVSTTRWVKAPPLVLTPIRIVGLSNSMVCDEVLRRRRLMRIDGLRRRQVGTRRLQ